MQHVLYIKELQSTACTCKTLLQYPTYVYCDRSSSKFEVTWNFSLLTVNISSTDHPLEFCTTINGSHEQQMTLYMQNKSSRSMCSKQHVYEQLRIKLLQQLEEFFCKWHLINSIISDIGLLLLPPSPESLVYPQSLWSAQTPCQRRSHCFCWSQCPSWIYLHVHVIVMYPNTRQTCKHWYSNECVYF